jgi:RNA polymerase sigma-70 factor (ECF subfamily)
MRAVSADRELVDRCARREPGAWEEFLARYRETLAAAAGAALARATGRAAPDEVDSAVQTTLVQLLERDAAALRAWEGRATLAVYLRAIATKVALNQVRGEARKGWLRFRPLEDAGDPAAAAAAATTTEDAEVAGLRAAMDRLPDRDRLLLKLFHLDGASYRQIARLLAVPVNAVSPMLIRARKKLRVLFGRGR